MHRNKLKRKKTGVEIGGEDIPIFLKEKEKVQMLIQSARKRGYFYEDRKKKEKKVFNFLF